MPWTAEWISLEPDSNLYGGDDGGYGWRVSLDADRTLSVKFARKADAERCAKWCERELGTNSKDALERYKTTFRGDYGYFYRCMLAEALAW